MRTKGNGRRGIASMLAMLYLVLFAVLAVGFAAGSATSAQVSHNDQMVTRALLAAESGADFIRHLMASLNLPYGTTPANLLNNVTNALAYNLNTTPNMGGNTVQVTGGAIHIPSATGWILMGGGAKFRATITQVPSTRTLDVSVRGAATGSTLSRGVNMQFMPDPASYALAGLDGITMSNNAYTDSYDSSKGAYSAATAGKNGSIVSNGNITLNNTVLVNGDARPGVGRMLTLNDNANVIGRRSPLSANVNYPSVTLPATYTSLGAVSHSSGTQNPAGGVYVLDSLTLSGTAVINWQGPVTLYIRNSYSVSGSVVINIYQNKPANRKIYFLPTCTTATWTGSNVCVGELYAPDTNFTISGSVQKFGRLTAKTINNSSSGGMHADDALPSPGGAGNYTMDPASYVEVP